MSFASVSFSQSVNNIGAYRVTHALATGWLIAQAVEMTLQAIGDLFKDVKDRQEEASINVIIYLPAVILGGLYTLNIGFPEVEIVTALFCSFNFIAKFNDENSFERHWFFLQMFNSLATEQALAYALNRTPINSLERAWIFTLYCLSLATITRTHCIASRTLYFLKDQSQQALQNIKRKFQ